MEISPEQLTQATSDPTRLRILALIDGGRERCVCELHQALELAQPKVSRHLAVLRQAGLVRDRREGLWIHYRINPALPFWAQQVLAALAEGARGREPFAGDRARLEKAVAAACS